MVDVAKRKKLPRDPNARAFEIVQIATGQIEAPDPDAGKDPAAVALGRRGGLKGGKARAALLTKEQRVEMAKIAARARWKKAR